MTMHWKAEGAFEYTNLLFVPKVKPFDLYDPRRHHGVKLFVKRVFITDGVEGLIPRNNFVQHTLYEVIRNKADITEEEYKEFYRHVSGTVGADEPQMTMHWKSYNFV